MLDSLLVPLDGSPLADRALQLVRHMIDQRAAFGGAPPRVLLLRAAEATDISQACAELAKQREALGPTAEARVVEGDAADAILRAAAEAKPSLVVMASHGRGGLDRWLRGSTAERVLRECPAPLLIVNPWAIERTAARSSRPFERILVPLDGSERANAVIPVVADLARDLGCSVVLQRVLPDPQAPTEPALEDLERARAAFGGLRVDTLVSHGRPAPAILDAVRSHATEMLAIATHGSSGPSSWFYGSVAEHVLHESACPLLVVRTGGFHESRTAEVPERERAGAGRG